MMVTTSLGGMYKHDARWCAALECGVPVTSLPGVSYISDLLYSAITRWLRRPATALASAMGN